jgi:hypothetical protein
VVIHYQRSILVYKRGQGIGRSENYRLQMFGRDFEGRALSTSVSA